MITATSDRTCTRALTRPHLEPSPPKAPEVPAEPVVTDKVEAPRRAADPKLAADARERFTSAPGFGLLRASLEGMLAKGPVVAVNQSSAPPPADEKLCADGTKRDDRSFFDRPRTTHESTVAAIEAHMERGALDPEVSDANVTESIDAMEAHVNSGECQSLDAVLTELEGRPADEESRTDDEKTVLDVFMDNLFEHDDPAAVKRFAVLVRDHASPEVQAKVLRVMSREVKGEGYDQASSRAFQDAATTILSYDPKRPGSGGAIHHLDAKDLRALGSGLLGHDDGEDYDASRFVSMVQGPKGKDGRPAWSAPPELVGRLAKALTGGVEDRANATTTDTGRAILSGINVNVGLQPAGGGLSGGVGLSAAPLVAADASEDVHRMLNLLEDFSYDMGLSHHAWDEAAKRRFLEAFTGLPIGR